MMTMENFFTILSRITRIHDKYFLTILCLYIVNGDNRKYWSESIIYNEIWNLLYLANLMMPQIEKEKLPGEFRLAIEAI